jgi:hypothetical protein
MMLNRREVLKAGLAVPLLAGAGGLVEPALAMPDGRFAPASEAGGPAWPRQLGRIGQLNMTEHDPVSLDIEAWADYWAGLKVGATYISVTGILAYYQTKVPFHRKGKFLGDQDFFGKCNQAARKRGMRTIARMSPDLNWEDATVAHPDWFERDQQGGLHGSKEAPGLFRTCMFSDYMTDYIPAIINEVTSLYEIDAVYCNGWPPLGSLPECYCAICRKLPPPETPAYWEKFNERMVYLWRYYDSLIQKTGKEKFFFPNMGGGVRAAMNLDEVGKIAQWFQGDNQGRGGEDAPIWGCALQGRVCQAIMDGKMAANITGAWSTGPIRWRNVGKSPVEAEMWFSETSASGLIPYYHIVGAEKGMGVDRRELDVPREYFGWTAKNEPHFANKSTIARIGVVMGQRTHLFHKTQPNVTMQQHLNGMYYALLEGRFLFDFVHDDRMDAERLSKYSALILPNVALLSDAQCGQLKAFVDRGGSLLATFETSLYDEKNQARSNFGLADVFGIEKTGEVIGTNGNAFYARIEREHDIVRDFKNTGWLPGAEYRVPLAPVESPVLTVVPGFTAYPPELAYPPTPNTNVPAVVLREKGQSRLAYIAGDVERSLWVSGDIDLSRLLRNTINWITHDEQPVTIEGSGLIEVFAYETEPGFALHVLNYTNPNAHRGLMREFNPIGEQKVSFAVPEGTAAKRVELLRSGWNLHFEQVKGRVEFTIPEIKAYEVAAIYA